MIAKKSYYGSTIEHKDRVLVEIYVDRELIGIMQSKILREIEDAAVYIRSETEDPDEIVDGLNYINDLVRSYKELSGALDEIESQEALSNIPPEEEENVET